MDYTGCGNTLDLQQPRMLQLIMDSLRYWVLEMHVDGFRFDLASALARELHAVDKLGAFFDILLQDPVLSQVKLIAEPWDLGEGGYQVGNFPAGWGEWNDHYRDTMRAHWKGESGLIGDFASRLTGSSDFYQHSGRKPYASVNFITAHDGFTLHDLVSYNGKHNDANCEDNRDGTDNNNSWNCGAEGPTDDAGINALRARQKRNMLATLFFSQGVPMLLAGDEMGRTQGGNNNAYCQDSEISWQSWDPAQIWGDVTEMTAELLRLRAKHPVLHPDRFRSHTEIVDSRGYGLGRVDLAWMDGWHGEMGEEAWHDHNRRHLGMYVSDATDAFLSWFNAGVDPILIRCPWEPWGSAYQVVVTSAPGEVPPELMFPGQEFTLPARAVVVMKATVAPGDAGPDPASQPTAPDEDIV